MATEIDFLIREKLRRARESTDPWIRKRANRNVFKFILDLAHSIGEAEATELLKPNGGTLEGILFPKTLTAASKASELKSEAVNAPSEDEDFLVDFALRLANIADKGKIDESLEKLRQEKYPA